MRPATALAPAISSSWQALSGNAAMLKAPVTPPDSELDLKTWNAAVRACAYAIGYRYGMTGPYRLSHDEALKQLKDEQ